MSNEKQVDSGRRGLLVATCAAGGVAGLATAGAFVSTFQPSERAKAAGAPVEVDIAGMAAGRNEDGRMARQAGVDPEALAGNDRAPEEDRRRSRRPEFRAQPR